MGSIFIENFDILSNAHYQRSLGHYSFKPTKLSSLIPTDQLSLKAVRPHSNKYILHPHGLITCRELYSNSFNNVLTCQ